MNEATRKTKDNEELKTKLKKVIRAKKLDNEKLVTVQVTRDYLLRNMEVARQGETIKVDKQYAEALQSKQGFKILK